MATMENFKLGVAVGGLALVVLIPIAAVIVLMGNCNTAIKKAEVIQKKVEGNVGRSIILQRDTLVIVDFSVFSETYTLSNGKKVSWDFVDKVGTLKED